MSLAPHLGEPAAPFLALAALVSVVLPAAALAQEAASRSYGREEIIAVAVKRAPEVLRAIERVRVAEARLVNAQRLTREDPSLQASAGPRFGAEISPEIGVSALLPVPLLVDRARSMEAARARIEVAELDVEAVRLAAAGVALDLYVRVLYAKERVALAKDRSTLAERLLAAASARLEAGDASQLEVELALAEKAASGAAVLAAEGAVDEASGDLAFALGLPALDANEVKGALAEQMTSLASTTQSLEHLVEAALLSRPDLRAAKAALQSARAEARRAELDWLPSLSVGAGYAYEEQDHIATIGVGISAPLYDFGQAERAEAAAARGLRQRDEELLRLAARVEVARAVSIHLKTLAAARLLDEEGVPRVAAAEELVTAGYSAGKTDLAALLIIRRDTLALRGEHLRRQLDAALAANRLAVVLGAVPTTTAGQKNQEKP